MFRFNYFVLNSDFESLDTQNYVYVCEYVDVEYTEEGAKIFVPFPYSGDFIIDHSIGFSADGVNDNFNGDLRMLLSITQKTAYGFFATFTGDLSYALNQSGNPDKIYVGYRGRLNS